MQTHNAVQLAERIWWVGCTLPQENLHANVYLIEQGDQSLLIDPGSRLTFAQTLRKIEQVIPFSAIRWFVCHHQEPSVTSSLALIDARVERNDARLVCHRLAADMIRHYDLALPFWLVEENQWQLGLGDRQLQFIFTPYAHFPGAFCTFDPVSGTLFSSDLFAGYPDGELLYASADENYFETIRTFHEHAFPSREILGQALSRIEHLPIDMIAPQHGHLLPGPLLAHTLRELKGVECGLYLMAERDGDIQRLSCLNALLKDITSTMVISRDFREIADRLLEILKRVMPAEALEFYVQLEDDTVLHLAPESRYRGVAASPPRQISKLFGMTRERWQERVERDQMPVTIKRAAVPDDRRFILLPLFRRDAEWMYGVAVISLLENIETDAHLRQMLEQISAALQVAVERETIYRSIELERQKFYERSIRDPLTGLFTRFYMEDTLRRLFEIHDRTGGTPVALAMLDVDHFKRINDQYGHVRGDEVLRRVAYVIQMDARAGDLPVRLGGEEFGLIVVGEPAMEIASIAERLRQKIAAARFSGTFSGLRITISIGTAQRQVGESIPGFIERADLALYRAKNQGRNRVCSADTNGAPGQWMLHFD
ncbi:MAG: diguanylate cyclase [Gammaproteobacteria bacterium]|nr:diguanylate cyclase [Gammaproteobacteria bacterium]MCB1849456.1 diguanylate cyclase [Gammaproteobacteria bacterium]MCP5418593.1 diguanylate cyclase [Chromatiaceae bacterium]